MCIRDRVRAERDGLGGAGRRRARQSPEIRRHRRAEEGCVGEPPAQLLGDDCDLHPRRPRAPVVGGRTQLEPARRLHGGVQLRGALGIVELGDGLGAKAIDHLPGGVAQRDLLG